MATFRIDEEFKAGMQFVRGRDGIPFSEQIRRGLRLWLDSKGVKVKAAHDVR